MSTILPICGLLSVFWSVLTVVIVQAAVCPDGWVKHNTTCYHFSHDRQEWTGAMYMCQIIGGYLVEVETAEEDLYLWNQVRSTNSDHWIGLHDLIEEDEWLWATSLRHVDTGSYTNWAPDQPNNHHGKENCVLIESHRNGQWNDDYCEQISHYICEKAASNGDM